VAKGVEYNLAHWPTADIRIGAQAHLEAFYSDFGFVKITDVYDEDGIPHIDMILTAAGDSSEVH